jgi:phage terminase large subunit-like protein
MNVARFTIRNRDMSASTKKRASVSGTIIINGADLKYLFIDRYHEVKMGIPRSFGGTT